MDRSPDRPTKLHEDQVGASDGDAEAGALLRRVGDRVRAERARRGMSRKSLARAAGVSERYLAQLEGGTGNISIALLRRVAVALNVPLGDLASDQPEPSADLKLVQGLLRRLSPPELSDVRDLLVARFAHLDERARAGRIALVGLRGAGKSTLGRALAEHRGVPFVELDAEIERQAGISLAEIFALYDQATFRRLERRCLDAVIEQNPKAVIATGGSIVAEAATYDRLLSGCFTVWLRTSPEEHMARVMAQGDLRPMAESPEAMADLRRILAARETLYGKADAVVDTAERTVGESLAALIAVLPE